ncbi:uncharacterized protein B0P05DRAFT_533834 [Gilbertella persicaria]|uniref:uncharacterized protein n=1 Tax=Gilbertella persicaria TaxID=101096 RepID=UPI00221F80F6|nr:uncharacterized protein B0P05DRAFT_533834 [Gilbertella persicaria]KAI8085814.1 hypothetical protein B0P05DRAFT_533834 [Gilbertella persicaria]
MILSSRESFQPNSITPIQLSDLCSNVVKILCGGNLMWDMDRLMNFSLFCNRLVVQLDISAPVIYTSLKYFQTILANSINEYNIIDLSDIAHEYSLFTVSLILAYKFLEDNPPYMRQWSFVSMISIEELVMLESQVLQKLDYFLSISPEVYHEWIEQCNALPFLTLEQLNLFDLHMTQSRLGYSILLPVLLDDFYLLPSLSSSPQSTASYSDCYYQMTHMTTALQTNIIPQQQQQFMYNNSRSNTNESSICVQLQNEFFVNNIFIAAPTTVPSNYYPEESQFDYSSCLIHQNWLQQQQQQQQQVFMDPLWYL